MALKPPQRGGLPRRLRMRVPCFGYPSAKGSYFLMVYGGDPYSEAYPRVQRHALESVSCKLFVPFAKLARLPVLVHAYSTGGHHRKL